MPSAAFPEVARPPSLVVVSGLEGINKSDLRIFAALCGRAGVTSAECLFIDDSPRNVAGAQAAGMQAHHFTTPEALEAKLTARGLL